MPSTTGTDGYCLLCGERGWTLVSRTDDREYHARWGERRFTHLIDIGCGDVKRVAYADCGAQGTAFDLLFSDRARALAMELNVECRKADVAGLPDNAYDLAFMRQLIEHLRDPRQALLNLRPKLKPGALSRIGLPGQ